MKLQDLKKYKLPNDPGVYLFKKSGGVLYVGKATSLKDRVRSYFSNDLIKTRGPRMIDMVTISNNLEFIKTRNVLEALVLEANLIKERGPKYNIAQKDDKSYSFLVITNEDVPKVYIERGRTLEFENNKKFKKVFGPYPSYSQLAEALKIIRKIFPYLTDKKNSHLYRQIGLEPDFRESETLKEYKNNIKNISLFFQGKFKQIEKTLNREMKEFAKKQEFEKAGEAKKKVFALKHIRDVSLIEDNRPAGGDTNKYRIEAYDIAHLQGANSVGVMTVIEYGKAKKADYRKFILKYTKKGDDVGGIKEILERRLKHTEWQMPDLIVIDGGRGQYNVALKIVGKSIDIVSVVKNEKHKPESFIGNKNIIMEHKKDILIANSEAHRFAITFYRTKQRKTLLDKK